MAKKVVIMGSGGIGRAVGLLLRELGEFEVDLYLGDALPEAARSAADFISGGTGGRGQVETFQLPYDGATDEIRKILDDADILLDCLPGSQAPRLARWCLEHRLHYANLTEYVAETNEVIRLASGAETGFALQNGLAPGYIDVLGTHLFRTFCERYGVDRADSLTMRVGALTQHAEAPHFYGFTWSPIGVATEYIKDAIVIRDWKKTTVPSLGDRRTLILNGRVYEEALTSGGAADLPDALAGRVRHLDYKTLRYPGHYAWVENQLGVIGDVEDRIKELETRFAMAIPQVEDDDVVVIYAAVEGVDAAGGRRRVQKALHVYPCEVGGQPLRAIQSTTAAGLAEAAHILLTTNPTGPVLQSGFDTEAYLNGRFVREIYR